MAKSPKIAPCLWFDNQAEEAARFYTGIFRKSKVTAITRYGSAGFEAHHRPAGSVMTVEFELDGEVFRFTPPKRAELIMSVVGTVGLDKASTDTDSVQGAESRT